MSELPVQTMKAVFDHSTTAFADRPSLSFVNGDPLTFAEFGDKVRTLQALYRRMGLRRGEKVALLGESMPNWGIAYYAAVTMGAVAVPILQEFHESAVHHIVEHSESRLAVVSERFMDKIAEGDFDRLQGIIRMDNLTTAPEDGLRGKVLEAVRNGRSRVEKFTEQARKLARVEKEEAVTIEEDDLACIIYTSGTTGHSKGVLLTHKNIVSNAQTASTLVDIGPQDTMLSVLPLAHTYECTFGLTFPLMQGCAVYYLEKPPSPRTLLPAMEKIRPTFLILVPLVMEKIFKNRVKPKLTGSSILRSLTRLNSAKKLLHKAAVRKLKNSFGGRVKLCCFGGAPLSPEVEEFLRNGGFPYAVGFGLTEASPLVSGCGPHLTKFKSCGPAIPGVSVRIANPKPDTGIGEIQVKGPNVMKGYY
ncbi:MAG: AMP-binding protein, partial [Proteobacteria bacterium]|nr:AMP-binding protein [Pseudomonadota bacterium]